MQSILKRVLSGASVVAALGAAASIQAADAHAYSQNCIFIPFTTNFCIANSDVTGLPAAYAAYNDGLGSDFLGSVDTFSDAGGNIKCKAKVTYANGSSKTTAATSGLNTSAYVAGANAQGWFVEGAGNQFPTLVTSKCP